ncbi:DUF7144 family membrane protein [Nocardia australiensis]|uniref:DUF7144 family membrane protein n=1 Tax=Nocardia australiensis TaxID=2887191 RepID=UPI001D13B6EE|nr:hypothetical protein [Nocardia australiensis]
MTDRRSAANRPIPEAEPFQKQSFVAGISIIAAIMLLIVGAVSVLQGVAALVSDDFYVTDIDYMYKFDTTIWGWIHLVLGVVALICAIGLMFGTVWGRYSALGIAALVTLANFLSLPYYPIWSVVIIALSVVVIWAVTTWEPEP